MFWNILFCFCLHCKTKLVFINANKGKEIALLGEDKALMFITSFFISKCYSTKKTNLLEGILMSKCFCMFFSSVSCALSKKLKLY